MNRSTVRAWYQASRPPFFVATLIPLTLGAALAHAEGCWSTLRWVAMLLASFLVHLCTNLANDYFDYLVGTDAGDSIGGSRVLQEGKITLSQIRTALILLYVAALLLGLWVVWSCRVWWLLAFMVIAFFSSLFYTAPPIRYGYLGLGEIFVALNMGPIMVVGTVAALCGHFSTRALSVSAPMALMVALILYFQSLPDIETDRAIGKITVAVRLGKPEAIWGFRLLVASAMLATIILVVAGMVHPAALLCVITLFLAVRTDRIIRETSDWKDLHERGDTVRIFYLVNGLILMMTVAWCG